MTRLYTILSFNILFAALFFLFVPFVFVSAFTGIEGMTVANIEFSPKYPTPGDGVKAYLNAPTIDDDTSLITWTVNGKVIQKTYGGNTISFVAENVGDVYMVTAKAEALNGDVVTAQRKVQVSDVVVVWEGRTYTPPFFAGRALQSQSAEVAFETLPSIVDENGNLYDPNELFYSWTINDASSPSLSGKGLHSAVLKNNFPTNDFAVVVRIKDIKGDVRAVKKIVVPASPPKIILYEDSPLVGIRYDSALKESLGVYGRKATVVAEPYYTSAKTRTDPVLEYAWSIDGTTYSSVGDITFEPAEDSLSGSSSLELVIKNTKYWLQNVRTSLTINFGQRSLWGDTNLERKAL